MSNDEPFPNPSTESSSPRVDIDSNALIISNSDNTNGRNFVRQHILEQEVRDKNVLHISFHESTEEIMTDWYRKNDAFPECLAMIMAADHLRSASSSEGTGLFMRYPYIETVTQPLNLNELGRSTVSLFQRWERNSGQTIIDFNSINELVDQCGLEKTFKFLHIFNQWVEKIDATCYYRYDSKNDETVVRQILEELFDTIVEIDVANQVSIR